MLKDNPLKVAQAKNKKIKSQRNTFSVKGQRKSIAKKYNLKKRKLLSIKKR